MKVRAIIRIGGVQRAPRVSTVQHGDIGECTVDPGLDTDYVSVYWPTRSVRTIEHVKDIQRVED